MFYASYLEAANTLKAKERDILYRAILEYGILGTEPRLNGAPLTCWILIKPQLDANNRKYENGKRGGRPLKKDSTGFDGVETTGYFKDETIGFSELKTETKPNEDVNAQQQPTAPPAAVAPHKGALGGNVVLDSDKMTERDSETEAVRQRFLNNMKHPACLPDV